MKQLTAFGLGVLFCALCAFSFSKEGKEVIFKVRRYKPFAAVQADKMNVLYSGVENPLTVAIYGVPPERMEVRASSNIILDGFAGKYTARVNSGERATIFLYEKVTNGNSRLIDSVKFRVKRLPDPRVYVGKKGGGLIQRDELKAQMGLVPFMENFEFDVDFRITSFEMTVVGRGRDIVSVRGNMGRISENMREIIGRARSGDRVYFENVRCLGPDGGVRRLASVSFTIR